MDVQTGVDNIRIGRNLAIEICRKLKEYPFETGGIIGMDKTGLISAFQFDKIIKPNLYEYYPDAEFLSNIINEEWNRKNIYLAGFIHSHLHNNQISQQDIAYAEKIICKNRFLYNILIGIVDLSDKSNEINFYRITAKKKGGSSKCLMAQ